MDLFTPRHEIEIEPITVSEADGFYRKYHYMGGVSTGRHYGFFKEGRLIGVATRGVLNSRFIPNLLWPGYTLRACELSRLCCEPGFRPLSRLVSLFIRECKREGYDVILTYADSGQGHIGTIYQATNFWYTGLAPGAGHLRWFLDGKEISPRAFYDRLGTASRDVIKAHYPNIKWKERHAKHRYVYPLTKLARKACEQSRKNFPKKVVAKE